MGLSLETKEKAWGPDYLDLGFTLEDSLDGRASYNLNGVVRATNINPLEEWRTELTLGDKTRVTSNSTNPLITAQIGSFPIVGFVREDRALYEEGTLDIDLLDGDTRVWLDAGYSLDTRGEFRLGFLHDITNNKLLGVDSLSTKVDDSRYFARAGFDTLDALGSQPVICVLGEYSIYDAKLGATRQYDGLTLDVLYPFYHRNGRTLIGQGYFGYLSETAVTDVTPRYSLGGFYSAYLKL